MGQNCEKFISLCLESVKDADAIAIEVDEEYHFINGELKEKDKQRQKNIEEALHCKFLRIREIDYLKNINIVKEILI